MNSALIIPLLATTLVAIVGWVAAHQFSAARDRINKRRDLRVQYLIDAYRKLEAASNRQASEEVHVEALESAVADLQLFGTQAQVAKTIQFVKAFAATGEAPLSELLFELRRDLRQELRLDSAPGEIMHIRIIPKYTEASVPAPDLDTTYQQMAQEEQRKAKALEWAEATMGDVADEPNNVAVANQHGI